MTQQQPDIQVRDLDHLGIIAGIIDQMGLKLSESSYSEAIKPILESKKGSKNMEKAKVQEFVTRAERKEPKAQMSGNDVLEILKILNSAAIDVWIDGGWGIDALVTRQTRVHSDLDVVAPLNKVDELKEVLGKIGFSVCEDELPARLVMKDDTHRQIDFHTVTFDEESGGIQKLQDGTSYRYPPEGFNAIGVINGKKVKCVTPEVQAECHYGYQPDDNDKHDMKLLHEYFGIPLTEPYTD